MDPGDCAAMIADWMATVDPLTAQARIDELAARYGEGDQTTRFAPTPAATLMRSAMHEAAHVAVGHALGLRVSRALIRDDGTGLATYHAADTAEDLVPRVVTDLAGCAHELLTGANPARLRELAQSHDVLSARLGADRCAELAPELGTSLQAFATLAVVTTAANRDLIERIGGALRIARELPERAIVAICERLN